MGFLEPLVGERGGGGWGWWGHTHFLFVFAPSICGTTIQDAIETRLISNN